MSHTETRTYTVRGMSCHHCTLSVTEEVGDLTGVEGVDVDLASGRMVVRGSDVGEDAVRAAVQEAGYELVGS